MSAAKTKKRVTSSQLIVVDANVLRGASSTDGGPPAGVECRSALQAILKICHRAVVSPALDEEYAHHASNFGQRWRTAMAQRNKIVATPAAKTGRSRGWMQNAGFTAAQRKAAEKDLHLVLAAWEKHAVVLSADEKSRVLFARLVDLASLGWARMTHDDIATWLDRGAPSNDVRLGLH